MSTDQCKEAIAPWGTRDTTRPFVWVSRPRARAEKKPHDPLPPQWQAPPLYLYVAWIKVWGLHIKQTGAFDVNGNTNTDLTRVVTAYLFPLVIHGLLVECVCLQRLAACTSSTVAMEALRGL